MQSAKKVKALSVLSMAAAAAVGLSFQTPTAKAATLNLYYNSGGSSSTAGTPDTISYGTSTSTLTTVAVDPSATAVTINIPVGDVLQFGINAVVTNNVNPVAGQSLKTTAGKTVANSAQPTNLGLNELSFDIASSDLTGSTLTPVVGGIRDTFSGATDYNSSAVLPLSPGGVGVTSAATDGGDVLQKGTLGGGDVGDHYGITPLANASASAQTQQPNLQAYAAATASPTNSASGLTNLTYTASQVGIVTLSTVALSGGTEYWSYNAGAALTNGGSEASAIYEATHFTNPGDSLGPNAGIGESAGGTGSLPLLVINITGTSVVTSGHAIISLTTGAPTSYGSSQGTLAITGSNGSYTHASVTFPAVATGYVGAGTFNPATDTEVYGVDVLDGGVQANQAELDALVAEINVGDVTNGVPASSILASSSATGTNPYDFATNYNLYLVASPGVGANDFLGIDLATGNDAALSGYTFSAVTVVPEPMSLGLLALGGLGLMTRRNRRKA